MFLIRQFEVISGIYKLDGKSWADFFPFFIGKYVSSEKIESVIILVLRDGWGFKPILMKLLLYVLEAFCYD